MTNRQLHTSKASEWLTARFASGESRSKIARQYGCSPAMITLIARGERRPTAAMKSDLRRWCASPSAMRRALPRIVRWLRGRQVRDDGERRVYGRGGRRV